MESCEAAAVYWQYSILCDDIYEVLEPRSRFGRRNRHHGKPGQRNDDRTLPTIWWCSSGIGDLIN